MAARVRRRLLAREVWAGAAMAISSKERKLSRLDSCKGAGGNFDARSSHQLPAEETQRRLFAAFFAFLCAGAVVFGSVHAIGGRGLTGVFAKEKLCRDEGQKRLHPIAPKYELSGPVCTKMMKDCVWACLALLLIGYALNLFG